MKKFLLGFVIVAFGLRASAAGFPVIDVANLAQAILEVYLASNQLFQAEQLLNRVGDPAMITQIAGAVSTLSQLGQPGVALSLPEIQTRTTGQAGLAYDGKGFYQPVQPDIPLVGGQTLARPIDAYRKHEAMQMAVANYDDVVADTQARREALRAAQGQTTAQLKVATTDAETQKLKGVLASQQAELNTVAAERSEAATRVSIQHLANEADKARQQQADDELRAASLQSALTHALRFFQADTRPSLVPDPKTVSP